MQNSLSNLDLFNELLDFLSLTFSSKMLMSERYELIHGTITNVVKEICNTVIDWSKYNPLLPYHSVKIIFTVRNILLTQSVCDGEALINYFETSLGKELRFGHYCFVHDIY